MSRKYFGTDGIRGPVGQFPITPEFILKLGWAAGMAFRRQGKCRILIGKDTRISGYMFESALEAGLVAAGADVMLLGPMPTPAIAYLTRTFQADAGIVISASHNPHHDNGFKFFSGKGTKLPDEIELMIEELLDQPMSVVESDQIGKVSRINDAAGRYIEFCKSSVPSSTSFAGLKLVIDCAHGATYKVAPSVFRELGAQVSVLSAQPNGLNINDNCGSTHLESLQAAVLEHGADLGIGLDGDADRCLAVDATGEVVDGDQILAILAIAMKEDHALHSDTVVATVMSNLGFVIAMRERGIRVDQAKVGDRYVLESMNANGFTLGGEQSGHVIMSEFATTGDGVLTALHLAARMARTGKPLAELAGVMTRLPQVMINVPEVNKVRAGLDPVLQQAVTAASRELGDTGRVLLRPSGTEPLVRVMVEAGTHEQAQEIAERLVGVVKARLAL